MGDVPPSRFIPAAEDTGLIIPFGHWILSEARRLNKDFQGCRNGHLNISVNLSARQFRSQDLADRIAVILENTGLDPTNLELEITESIIMQDVDENILTLRKLKDMGIRLSVDDFGTRYSSLNYLLTANTS